MFTNLLSGYFKGIAIGILLVVVWLVLASI